MLWQTTLIYINMLQRIRRKLKQLKDQIVEWLHSYDYEGVMVNIMDAIDPVDD